MNPQVSIVRCKDYQPDLVEAGVRQAVGSLGGIAKFIKPNSKVLVKPNLLMAIEPEKGIDTHPEIVRSVIKLLKEINCEIFVGDGPSVWGNQAENVDDVYQRSGIRPVCQQEGVSLVKFEHKRWRKNFPLTTWLDNCDYLVSLPKFKTHDLTLLTGAVKNLFGLVWGTHKTELHKKYFQPEEFNRILVDIYQEAKPALTIVDGITAMEGDGPATSGKLRDLGLIFAGVDCVAIDSVLAKIMGVRPEDVASIKEAVSRGIGCADINAIEFPAEKLADVLPARPFVLPQTSLKKKIPLLAAGILKKLIKYYPVTLRENCIKCGACVEACPNKVISMRKRGVVFNYANCISCFCCQEACPAAAIKVGKSLFAKIIGL